MSFSEVTGELVVPLSPRSTKNGVKGPGLSSKGPGKTHRRGTVFVVTWLPPRPHAQLTLLLSILSPGKCGPAPESSWKKRVSVLCHRLLCHESQTLPGGRHMEAPRHSSAPSSGKPSHAASASETLLHPATQLGRPGTRSWDPIQGK